MKNCGKARVLCVNALVFCILIATSSCFAATQPPAEWESGEETTAKEAAEARAAFIKVYEEMAELCKQGAEEVVEQLVGAPVKDDDIEKIIKQAMLATNKLIPKKEAAFQLLSQNDQDAVSNFWQKVAPTYREALSTRNYTSRDDACEAIQDFIIKLLSGIKQAFVVTATEEKEIVRS